MNLELRQLVHDHAHALVREAEQERLASQLRSSRRRRRSSRVDAVLLGRVLAVRREIATR